MNLLVAICLTLATPHAIDGDTVRICGYSLRLDDYDAPEMAARCPDERRRALLAKAEITRLLPSLAFWQVPCATSNYGRLCAHVDGLAEHMISRGLAVKYIKHNHPDWCKSSH